MNLAASRVIMSVNDYLTTPPLPELRAMQQRAIETGANKLRMRQIDSIVEKVRCETATTHSKNRARRSALVSAKA